VGVESGLLASTIPVGAVRFYERRRAHNFCDDIVVNYHLAANGNPGTLSEEYVRDLTDQVLSTTTLQPDGSGGFSVDKRLDPSAVTISPRFFEPVTPSIAAMGGYMLALSLSYRELQDVVRWPFGILGAGVAAAGVVLSESQTPIRNIGPYMKQLDNIDGGGLRMELPN
jgi:hypothetical protein